VLSRSRARWSEILSAYDYVIKHLEGSKILAYGQSRWPNYQIAYRRPVAHQWASISVKQYNDPVPAIIAAQAPDPLAVDIPAKLVDWTIIAGKDTAKENSQCKVVMGVVTYEGRMYVPAINSLRGKVISLFHDIPESGHFGPLMITELVSRNFYWPVMDMCVGKYVSSSKVCHWIKAPRHARHGINMPLETP